MVGAGRSKTDVCDMILICDPNNPIDCNTKYLQYCTVVSWWLRGRPGLDLSSELLHHVVGQEVLARYDQHQLFDHQEVVNTDPASDQHHGQDTMYSTYHHPHYKGLVSPFRIHLSHATAEIH